MQPLDKIVFGDNQFFGINHMSQEKAQQLTEKFYDINNIYKVYDLAYNNGIKSFFLNSNDRAIEICNHFKENRDKYPDISFYASIPYPYKYANMVAEKGIMSSMNDILFKGNTVGGAMGMIVKGGMSVISKDAIKLMQILIDMEMKMFKGLDVKVIFLQNIISDLVLGYDIKKIFVEYVNYIKKKYNAIPGLITQNLPHTLEKMNEWGIKEMAICFSFNKIGYLMSPNVESYLTAIEKNNPNNYQLMAMSTLASGAINPNEAYAFLDNKNIQSVVFGASSETHIAQTKKLVDDIVLK